MATTDDFLDATENATVLVDSLQNVQWNFKEASFSFVLLILVCLCNLLIIFAFAQEKRLRVYSNYYIINMTIADTLVGLTSFGPSVIYILHHYQWPFGYVSCAILTVIAHTSLHVSILMVLVICVDRWYAVCHPLKHMRTRSKRSAVKRNLLVWSLSFAIWVPMGVRMILDPINQASKSCSPLYTRQFATTIASSAVLYWLPVTCISILYFMVYRQIRSSEKERAAHSMHTILRRQQDVQSDISNDVTAGLSDGGNSPHTESQPKQLQTLQSLPPIIRLPCSAPTSSCDTLSTVLEVNVEPADSSIQDESSVSSPERFRKQLSLSDIKTDISTSEPLQKGDRKRDSRIKDVRVGGRGGKDKPDISGNDASNKAQRTLSFLVVALVVTWTPYAIFLMTTSYCHVVLERKRCFSFTLSALMIMLSWCNSLINPFMYTAAQPLVRETVVALVSCKM